MNGGYVFGNSIDIKVVCGEISTKIEGPKKLPLTSGTQSYLMVYPENEYVLEAFVSTTLACSVTEL